MLRFSQLRGCAAPCADKNKTAPVCFHTRAVKWVGAGGLREPRCPDMPAAAQAAADSRRVGMGTGAHTDFEVAVRLLPQGDPHPDPFDLTGNGSQPLHVVLLGPAGGNHIVGDEHHRAAAAEMKAHAVQRQTFQLHPRAGLGIKHGAVNLLAVNADVHQRRRHPVGVRVGVGVLEAAGVGGQAGIQAFGHTAVQRGFQEPDYREYQHSGGRSARVRRQQKAGIGGVGAVVMNARIFMFSAQRLPGSPAAGRRPHPPHRQRRAQRRATAPLPSYHRISPEWGPRTPPERFCQGTGERGTGHRRSPACIPVGILMGQQ